MVGGNGDYVEFKDDMNESAVFYGELKPGKGVEPFFDVSYHLDTGENGLVVSFKEKGDITGYGLSFNLFLSFTRGAQLRNWGYKMLAYGFTFRNPKRAFLADGTRLEELGGFHFEDHFDRAQKENRSLNRKDDREEIAEMEPRGPKRGDTRVLDGPRHDLYKDVWETGEFDPPRPNGER